ncbi:MAG: CpsD/CapB family tyrosine-protein kinase [Firmicutes bacterium]|nr:CpsD/CapB family tyrosine-protein kinase [Bacillota bacterium]
MFGKKGTAAITDAAQRRINSLRIINDKTTFDVRESFNELRTNIVFSMPAKGTKKVLVTSSIASEGKSTTCLNMAITFAEAGTRTLLIDCDLRVPNVGKLIGDDEKKGLSNILVSDCSVDEALHHTQYKNLDVLLSGSIPPNPTELLASDAMSTLIDELSEKYDYILFDAPPVNVVSDAVIISRLVSGVIIVCRQYVADKKMLTATVEKLKFANTKILGIVLNDVSVTKTGYGKYGRYGKYGGYSYSRAAGDSEEVKA